MGLPIDEKEVPLDMQDLSYNCQQALFLFNVLPDKVEGMNGMCRRSFKSLRKTT